MPHVSFLVRRDSGGISTSTIIIIAVVAGSVVILVFALFAWRLLARSCRRSKTVPLPPVQDLAHHREQQLAAYADHKADRNTWVDSSYLHPPVYSSRRLAASGSSSSLMRNTTPDFTASHGPTRESSWAIDDLTSAESSPGSYPISMENLQPPNPSFIPAGPNPHLSMSSVASSSSDIISEANAGLPASPSEMTHSVESSFSLPQRDGSPAPARPRPPRTPVRSQSRAMSIVSSAGTLRSVQTSHSTGNVLRGAPHSIHSSIQIVLPAPLAPGLYQQQQQHPLADAGGDRQSVFGGSDRRSAADPWILAGSRPQSMVRHSRAASGSSQTTRYAAPRPSQSQSRPRSSLSKVASTSSLRDSDSASARARRASSQPPLPSARSAPAFTAAASSASRAPRSRTPSPGPGSGSGARSHPPRSASVGTSMGMGMGMGMGMMLPDPDAFQPHSPMPPVPRIPSMYGREAVQGFNGGGVGAGGSGSGYFPPQPQVREALPPQLPAKDYEPQPSRGRPLRAAPTQVPPQGQGQGQAQGQGQVYAPVPVAPSAYREMARQPSSGKLRKSSSSRSRAA